ncbi:MAG: NAD(P)/FAD-dependent oxidoreductase [Candidatus Paceibacterota bacterium]|jgi:NADH dehydrogenase
MNTTGTPARIVVLGGGFGGVYTGKYLLPLVRRGIAEMTIVSDTNHFLFTPLLHEVATGNLSAGTVAEPLREIFRGTGTRIVHGTADAVDMRRRIVSVGSREIPYDYLVVSCGSKANYYNIPGAKEHGLPLKNISDALRIRNRIIDAFDRAAEESDADKRKNLLSFAVVGGGPTGVELAAEIAEFAHAMADNYYCNTCAITRDDVQIALVSAGSELLEYFHPAMRAKAKKVLEKKGVSVHTGIAVTAVDDCGVCMADGACIPASVILWVAGVTTDIPAMNGGDARHSARIPVDEYLRVNGEERVFAVGDAAAFTHQSASGTALPMLAQVTVQEAAAAARNIKAALIGRKLVRFRYHHKGALVSLGEWYAMGDIFGMRLYGRLMWLLWRTIYLFTFISWRKRFRIALEWIIELIYPRDITRLS